MNYLINQIINDLRAGLDPKDIGHFFVGHSYALPDVMLDEGIIEVIPVSSEIQSVATGMIDQGVNTLKIVVMRCFKTTPYTDPHKETATDWLARVIDGREANGTPKTNSVRYILRNHLRHYGTIQPTMTIEYNSPQKEDTMGTVSAFITLVQEEQVNQPLS